MRSSVETAPAGRPRRVLVVSADMGAGHNATATALEQQILRRWPGSTITRVDTLDVMGSAVGPVFRRIYVSNVEHTPWLYEFFYASLWRQRWFADASKRFTGTWAGRRLAPIIATVEPDFIVSTYPLGSSGLAWLRRHRGLAVPTGAWVSDFAPHPFWVYGDVDLTVVMHEVSADSARAAEPRAQVLVDPLPTPDLSAAQHQIWCSAADKSGRFTILVACGSYSFGDVLATITAVLDASPDVRVVAACGRNVELQQRLHALGHPPDRLRVLGWTHDMGRLLAAADLLITNGGGVTALEAFAVGTPVLMYRPIAAHGVANANLMVVAGLADVVNEREHLPDYIRAVAAGRPARPGRPSAPRVRPGPDALQRLADLPSPSAPGVSMSFTDAYFVHLDTPDVRQELGVLLELDPRPDGSAADPAELGARLTSWLGELPALRGRIVRGSRPGWRPRPDTAADSWLVGLPLGAGAGDRLLAAVTAFSAEPLPDEGPLFRAGLAQDPETRRSLVVLKMHHSVADGLGSLSMLDRLFDAAPAPAAPAGASGNGHRRSAKRRPTRGAALRILSGVVALAGRGFAPAQPLTRRPVGARRVIGTWDVPTAAFRSAAGRLGVRSHVLALGLLGEALSRLLVPAGLATPDRPLRVMVPTTLRGGGDRRMGNKTGTIALDLPMQPMPLPDRLAAIAAAVESSVRRGEPQAGYAVLRAAGRLPGRLPAAFIKTCYHRRFFHAILTYLPGTWETRRLTGAPVRAAYPIMPLAPTVPLTAGLLTFGPTACIGIQLDAGLNVPAEDVRHALDEAWASLLAED